MTDYLTLFVFIIFVSQILVFSFYLPIKWHSNRASFLKKYPQSEFPNLFSQPIETEHKRLKLGRNMNLAVGVAGFVLLLNAWISSYSIADLEKMVLGFAMLQLVHISVWGFWDRQNVRLMNKYSQRKTRTTEFSARRLSDFVAPFYVGIAIIAYLATIVFGAYIYLNELWDADKLWALAALLIMNTVFGAALSAWGIFKGLYGKRQDPYLAHQDRMKQIERSVSTLVFTSIFYSVFIFVLCLIVVFDLAKDYTASITSIFMQVFLVFTILRTCRIFERDFSVYKAETTQGI